MVQMDYLDNWPALKNNYLAPSYSGAGETKSMLHLPETAYLCWWTAWFSFIVWMHCGFIMYFTEPLLCWCNAWFSHLLQCTFYSDFIRILMELQVHGGYLADLLTSKVRGKSQTSHVWSSFRHVLCLHTSGCQSSSSESNSE
jgi:hypothetical protein